MSYNVAVPETVKKKIQGWGFNRNFETLIFEALREDLSTVSESQLGPRAIAPIRFAIYEKSLTDPETRKAYLFKFWVNDKQDPETRILIDADYSPA